jgi:hypothetical protein
MEAKKEVTCDVCGEQMENVSQFLEHREERHDDDATYTRKTADFTLTNVKPMPRRADACKKLLDNGWMVGLWLNPLGSYTAQARNQHGNEITTDDFEPSQALFRLTEKVFGAGEYAS